MNSTGFGLGLGSSKSRKNAWYSTQIFQKILQQSRLAIMNSSVSWQLLCYRDKQKQMRHFLKITAIFSSMYHTSMDSTWFVLCVCVCYASQHNPFKSSFCVAAGVLVDRLTFKSGRSLMRNLFLLKLSFLTLDQLNALILVCAFKNK